MASLLLVGCGSTAQYENQQRAKLNSVVDSVGLDSLGTIICDLDGGRIGLSQGMKRKIMLEDASLWAAAGDALVDAGFTVRNTPPYLSGSRSDGFLLAGRLIATPGDQPDLEAEMTADGCEVPSGGAIYISFEVTNAA